MLDLERITLVTISTKEHAASQEVISKCLEVARFNNVVVFTNRPAGFPGICLPVEPRSYQAWCIWRLTEFPKHRVLFSDFVLLVESDSGIVNPAAWTDDFYNYDYIGAPWPHDHSAGKFFPGRCVGNGGFCLMSNKLLAAVDALKIPPTVAACHPCDMKICLDYRPQLEAKGYKFAPVEVADRFSNEDGEYIGAFGAHSRYMLDLVRWKTLLSRSPAGRV